MLSPPASRARPPQNVAKSIPWPRAQSSIRACANGAIGTCGARSGSETMCSRCTPAHAARPIRGGPPDRRRTPSPARHIRRPAARPGRPCRPGCTRRDAGCRAPRAARSAAARHWSPRLVSTTMSAVSASAPSASRACGTRVCRAISVGKKPPSFSRISSSDRCDPSPRRIFHPDQSLSPRLNAIWCASSSHAPKCRTMCSSTSSQSVISNGLMLRASRAPEPTPRA